MANSSAKNYDTKVVAINKSTDYLSFGWLRSKDRVPDDAKVPKKSTPVLMKRKIEFGLNPQLTSLENDYEKLTKKKYRQLPILGILFFLLMLALFAVAGVCLYYGISAGVEAGKYPGTYYFYTAGGEKVEATSYVLTKDTWSIGEGEDALTGKLELKSGKLNLYTEQGEDDETEDVLLYTATVKDGVLTVTYVEDGTTLRYYSDDCKVEEKSSFIPEEDEPQNADDAEAGDVDGEEEAEEAEEGGFKAILGKVKEILDKVHDEYLSKVTGIFEGKTNEETGEYTEGIADKVANMVGPVAPFITADTLVGIVALILAIVFLICFAEIAKIKKKRRKRDAKVEVILEEAAAIVEHMKRTNPQLMPKANRKAYMWENIIANALIRANGNNEDDDEDY